MNHNVKHRASQRRKARHAPPEYTPDDGLEDKPHDAVPSKGVKLSVPQTHPAAKGLNVQEFNEEATTEPAPIVEPGHADASDADKEAPRPKPGSDQAPSAEGHAEAPATPAASALAPEPDWKQEGRPLTTRAEEATVLAVAANNEQVFAALRPFFRPKTFGDTSKQITWWAVCDCHQRSGFLPDRQTVLDAIQAACDENPAMLNDLEYEEVGPLLEYVYASEDRAKYRSSPLAQEALRIGKQLLCDRVTGELRQALRPEQGRAPTHDSELVTATAARMAAINAIGMIPPQPLVQTWQQLNERYPNPQRAPKLIDGLLREEEILMLVSGPKLRKSWTVMSLAMAVATGQSWLGRNVRQGKVLLIDAELSGREFNARRTRVASALKACTGALSDNLRFCLLRGRTGSSIRTDRQGHLLPATGTEPYTIADLERDVFAKIKYGEYAMIIVDPLYKLLPTGMSEIDDDGWRTIFQILDRIATRTGAAIVVIHHANKGKQRDKSITDVGSGSGVISRAPDTHAVLLRRDDAEQDDTRAVLRAVTRSFPPAPDTYLRLNASEDVSLWEVDPEGKEGTGGGNASKVVEFEMAASDFGRFASTKPELRDAIIGRAMAAGVSERKAKQLFAAALSVGVVVKAEGMRSYYCRPESIQDRLNQQLPEAHKTQSDPQPPAGGPVPTAP